ncbi:hypothetical protein [Aquitalea sp. LB_tupeE]|uniref:hypothetical protein n=1 Tax=Aquitalea sp. LB_tupeE TaxID=2748078 RepID=UPI0015B9F916|nr:hypothetical protein [Aquitalea sp. LB_tupeE]NWK78888.1 hypothetical protein [Aquitalea sp. LB_tupeE]
MSQAWLSYDAAPPPWLPGSFFVASLIWLLIAGLTLLVGDTVAANRFDPLIVTLTHLLALGVLGNSMLGAVLQLLAVAAGVGCPQPRALWWRIFPAWQGGVACLCWGFSHGFSATWLTAGALLTYSAGLGLLAHALPGLWRSPARDATSQGLRLALTGLGVALTLGLLLVLTLGGQLHLPFMALLHSHVLWAGLGGLLALLLAVSQTVIPLFLIAPAFPAFTRQLLPGQLALLLALGLVLIWQQEQAHGWLLLASLPAACFAGLTLHQLHRCRRRQDPLWLSWLLAMLALLLGLRCAAAALYWPTDTSLPLYCGVLWLGGLGLGCVLGMLGKIAPFLAWLHLQRLQPPRGVLPATHGFLSEQAVRWLTGLHGLWLLTALAWCRWPASWQTALAISTLLLASTAVWHGGKLWLRYRQVRALCLKQTIQPAQQTS